MNRFFAGVLCLLAGATMACGPKIQVNNSDTALRKNVADIIQSKQVAFENQMAQDIVTEQLFGFFSCVKQMFGESRWNAFMDTYANTQSISRSFLTVYDETTFQVAARVITHLETELPSQPGGEMKSETVGDFEVHYVSGTKVERDLPKLKYLLSNYQQTVGSFFFSSPDKKDRFEQNVSNLKGGKIQLYLLDDAQHIEQQFGDTQGLAAALLSHQITDNGIVLLDARVLFKYVELFTAYTFTHELAHIYWVFCHVDPALTKPMPAPELEQLRPELTAAFEGIANPGQLTEGVAEYVTGKQNLLGQYGVLDPIQDQIRHYVSHTGAAISIAELDKRIYDYDFPGYELAQSLFTFLVDTYGQEAALALSYTAGDDDNYLRHLNTSKSETSEQWSKMISDIND